MPSIHNYEFSSTLPSFTIVLASFGLHHGANSQGFRPPTFSRMSATSMSSMSMTSSAAAEIARAPQKRLRSLSGAPRDFGIENDHTKRAYNRVLGDARRSKGVADTSIWKKKTCSPSTIPSAARRANRRNRIAWRHPVKRRRAKLESNSPRDNRCDSSRTMSRGGAAAPPRLAPCTPPRLAPCTHLTKT